jgi:hypothetical protein
MALCVIGLSLAIIRNYYTPLPKKRGVWEKIHRHTYLPIAPWLIGSWLISITLTYLLYKLEIMAAFAIINSMISFPAILITLIIVRKHRKKIVRSIPVFIIIWWVVITTLLILTGILTKLGIASEMLVVILQISAWLFIITATVSIGIMFFIFISMISWDLAANVSGKLYK